MVAQVLIAYKNKTCFRVNMGAFVQILDLL
jgi:hypothetical protein